MQINGIEVSEKIRDRLHDSLSFRLPRNIHFYRNYCVSVTTVFQTSGTPEYGWPLLGPLKPNRIIAPIGRFCLRHPSQGTYTDVCVSAKFFWLTPWVLLLLLTYFCALYVIIIAGLTGYCARILLKFYLSVS